MFSYVREGWMPLFLRKDVTLKCDSIFDEMKISELNHNNLFFLKK
jgi:hypothetical protein